MIKENKKVIIYDNYKFLNYLKRFSESSLILVLKKLLDSLAFLWVSHHKLKTKQDKCEIIKNEGSSKGKEV